MSGYVLQFINVVMCVFGAVFAVSGLFHMIRYMVHGDEVDDMYGHLLLFIALVLCLLATVMHFFVTRGLQ